MSIPFLQLYREQSVSLSVRCTEKSKDETQESGDSEESEMELRKVHTMTVCLVPESKYDDVWKAVTKARTELKDPGLFRWPPHANILYPFFDIKPKNDSIIDEGKLDLLRQAIQKCDPFRVSLDSLGTFGGKSRGVLYLYPRSFNQPSCDGGVSDEALKEEDITPMDVDFSDTSSEVEQPLIELQSTLQEFLPECNDSVKNGKFTPHITLSHFHSLHDALEGQTKIESWWKPLEFDVNEIYLLKRVGDDGQFKILATLPLGSITSEKFKVHDPPIAFPHMPEEEVDWVREERMKLKARRNGNGRRGKRKSRRTKRRGPVDRGPSKSRDSPDVIAQKRADRAAKRERLAQEAAAIASAISDDIFE